VILIVNLFDIDEKYQSHPNYPYRIHIKNIADSFDDEKHKQSAMFHDLGKLCKDFQTYINPDNPNKQKTTHAILGALLYVVKNNYQLDKKLFAVFLSVLRHHGNLNDVNELSEEFGDEDYLLDRNPEIEDKLSEIRDIISFDETVELEEICDCFVSDENFVEENNLGGIDSYYQIKETFSKLIFADKYEAIFKQKYTNDKTLNAEKYIKRLETHLSKKTNDLSPVRNSARTDILEKFSQNTYKSIYIIEAPTGVGKTFTALHLALEIVKQKKKNRIITALPMTSIIDQTYVEYSKIFEEDVLLKYHHLTSLKPRNADERNEEKSEQDYYKQKESFLTKSWSEDNVIITTFNQILNLFYSNRNRDLIKLWTLRNSVIILDEIQAIPRVLLKDFAKTISFLSKAFDIDFILMSATVPEIKDLLDNEITVELLDNKYFSKDFNNRYSLIFDKSIDSEERLIEAIENKFGENKSVLTVANSKPFALQLYSKLVENNGKNDIFLLSANFIPKHRKEIISEISRKLKNREKLILISTQVVEAGVDLDFDCGFREFAPFYAIVQTAGRVNRENRKEVKESASLIVCEQIGPSPYHNNDLLQEEVEELLPKNIRENNLLPFLRDYFKMSIGRTPPEMKLISKMEYLEFQKTVYTFNANFMQKQPWIMQLFIEIEDGIYEQFYEKLEILYEKLREKNLSLDKKMEIKNEIKEIYKQISQFVVNVPQKEVVNNEEFYKNSEMKVCRFDNLKECYSEKTGYYSPQIKSVVIF